MIEMADRLTSYQSPVQLVSFERLFPMAAKQPWYSRTPSRSALRKESPAAFGGFAACQLPHAGRPYFDLAIRSLTVAAELPDSLLAGPPSPAP
jgi:hypothetical protein